MTKFAKIQNRTSVMLAIDVYLRSYLITWSTFVT